MDEEAHIKRIGVKLTSFIEAGVAVLVTVSISPQTDVPGLNLCNGEWIIIPKTLIYKILVHQFIRVLCKEAQDNG